MDRWHRQPARQPATAKQSCVLQNEIRNAINISVGRDPKIGVEPDKLKWAMRTRGIDVASISIRAQRLAPGSELLADYRVWLNGELLFRLKLVPWEHSPDARWHVGATLRPPGGGPTENGARGNLASHPCPARLCRWHEPSCPWCSGRRLGGGGDMQRHARIQARASRWRLSSVCVR